MKMLKLTDREWGEFMFKDIFDIKKGFYNKKPPCPTSGKIPFIGASDSNNGFTGFTTDALIKANSKVGYGPNEAFERKLFKGNAICVTNNGSVGYAYYQQHPFTCTHDVNPLYLANHTLNRHIALFIISCIEQQRVCFAYARKWRPKRMVKSRLKLPKTSNSTPDWAFMEAFMKQVEEELLSRVRPKLENQLLDHVITLGALEKREWREFYFSDVFTRVQRGKRLKKDDHIEGLIPYVSSKANNNGIDGFVGNMERVRIFSNCISLANSGSVGSAFFQEFEFVASDHVTTLQKKGIDKYTYLFMLPIICRLSEKYSFNREINDLRISRERIMLPIQADGTPDWEFMSAFMKKVEQDTLSTALLHFKPKKSEQMLMGGVK